ncbi:hypothetical protein BMS3Abin04_02870 [bacterium BMS3Abin04]|nr:hypothetical protein BMS3Abin04_02870 [bacterium BMS3Abin04]
MSYYFSKTLNVSFDEAIEKITVALKSEGFGVVTDFDVSNALKNKLGIDFRPYRILGACNPPFANEALQAEDKIGTMLPCNVIVQQNENGIEIAAIDPVASMEAVKNDKVVEIAEKIQNKLKTVIDSL